MTQTHYSPPHYSPISPASYSPISPASFGDGSFWTVGSVIGSTPDDAIVISDDDDDDDGAGDTTVIDIIICEMKKIVAAINIVIGLLQQ